MSKSKTVWATIGGVLSSLLALLGVVGCCGLPILAGILSFLGIGASQLSFFAEYRGWFIGFAVICLLFGFWQVYFRKPKKDCCGGDPEPSGKPKQGRAQKIILWIGAVLIILILLLGVEEKQTASECCPAQTETVQPANCCPNN